MKKTLLKAVIVIMALTIGCLSLTAGADFSRVNTYTDGMFADVTADQWYAESVKNAYEFGLMNGKGAAFDPNGNLKVSEAITVAARIYETISGKAIPEVAGAWYQKYIDYAIANGFVTVNQFDNYDRLIKRFEMASVLSDACGDLPAINAVASIPDVSAGSPYFAKLIKLYNAGILTGNDAYGTFKPDSNLKRSEISAMAVRIADSTQRKLFTPVTVTEADATAYGDAYYLIDGRSPNGRNGIANGWNYDNRYEFTNYNGADRYSFFDVSDVEHMAIYRDFDAESDGIFKLKAVFSASSSNGGWYMALQAANEKKLFGLTEKGGYWTMFGTEEVVSSVAFPAKTAEEFAIVVDIDYNKHNFTAYVDNVKLGTVGIPADAMTRLVFGTNKVGTGVHNLAYTKFSKNYAVNERFLTTPKAASVAPYGWNITGGFAHAELIGQQGRDVYSMKTTGPATATKSFDPVTGKFSFQTYILLPEKADGAEVSLMSGAEKVFKFETKNGNIVMGNHVLNDYIGNIWQLLQVEADTNTGKADIKVNGKYKVTVDFAAKSFDSVYVSFAGAADKEMWFDDVVLFNIVDHADYPAQPQVASSDGYNVGVDVCWLWRDTQSGEGWDSVSPFPELEPYMGYYDEGLRETADWELKYMAEHGIDFMHACWYAPVAGGAAPIKQMAMSYYPLHEGYMNAKYSDLVDFCIMWENALNGSFISNFEEFKEYIWNYWVEHYFKDDRYARFDNKAVLSIYDMSGFLKLFGDESGCKEVIDFMDEEIKKLGYDGLILLCKEGSSADIDYMGFDATFAYVWGEEGMSADYQIYRNNNANYATYGDVTHIPTISIGFNSVGRNELRTGIITQEGYQKVCEYAKDLLDSRDDDSWRGKTLILSTWNEFSEGHYIAPTEGTGFSYLETIRKVFTNDTSDHSAIDVKLTKAQLDRISKLYPDNHSPIRRLLNEKNDYEELLSSGGLIPILSYDMSKASDASKWKAYFGISNYSDKGGCISGEGSSGDYAVQVSPENLDASLANVVHIRMKTSILGSFQVFFTTEADTISNDRKGYEFPIQKEDEYFDYYIDLTTNSYWNGTIKTFRIDPCTVPSQFEISLVEFLTFPTTEEPTVISVNNNNLKFNNNPKPLSNGDFEVYAEARHMGFYSMMRLYHEWDRFTGNGVLTLKSYNDNTLVFKVGSDKVIVNGVEKNLGYTFKIYDGIPVFQIKNLCDLLGYKYTVEANKIIITAASDAELSTIAANANKWEFDVDFNLDSWKCYGGTSEVSGGFYNFKGTGSDPQMKRSVNFEASDYTHLVVGITYNPAVMDAKTSAQLFFATSEDPNFSEGKSVRAYYRVGGRKEGDVVELSFALKPNSFYRGTITEIRIDPFNAIGDFAVDYVRMVKK